MECERMGGGQGGEYGRVVRIVLDRHDQRIFTPTPCGSPAWKRGYRRRTALERINARVARSFEFEPHFLRGLIPGAHARGLGRNAALRAPAAVPGRARAWAWRSR